MIEHLAFACGLSLIIVISVLLMMRGLWKLQNNTDPITALSSDIKLELWWKKKKEEEDYIKEVANRG